MTPFKKYSNKLASRSRPTSLSRRVPKTFFKSSTPWSLVSLSYQAFLPEIRARVDHNASTSLHACHSLATVPSLDYPQTQTGLLVSVVLFKVVFNTGVFLLPLAIINTTNQCVDSQKSGPTHQDECPGRLGVAFQTLQETKELVCFKHAVRVRVCDAVHVLHGAGIDVLQEFLATNIGVHVENAIVSLALINTDQAVRQTIDVQHGTQAPVPSEGVAHVGRVGGEDNPTDLHLLDASIVNAERVGLRDLVLVRVGMAREEPLEGFVAAFDVLFLGQAASQRVAIRDTPQPSLASFGDQAPELRVNHVVAAVPSVFLKSVIPNLDAASCVN